MDNMLEKLTRLRQFIGNTPLIRIYCEIEGKPVNILAKYEAKNLTGSIKDRMALEILSSAYNLGTIMPGDTIVEATSGNTGIAFAAIGAFLGHPVEIYMPDWLSEERKRILRFHGAKLVEISKKQGGFLECIELAKKKSMKKGFFGPKQFDNSWNVMAHAQHTAPEVYQSMTDQGLGNLDVFIAGAGTGGTVMGFYHYFSTIRGDNDNFISFPIFPVNNSDKGHRIEGIGDSFVPKILDLDSLGDVLRVEDSDAINISRQINKLGLSVGISSGANVFGAIVKASELPEGSHVATILCDDNKKYLTTDLCSDTTEELSKNIKILDFELLS